MHRKYLYILLICILAQSVQGQDRGMSILKEAERYRAPWNQMKIKAELNAKDNRGRIKNSLYSVYFKDQTKTLAGFIEPRFEKGNLLLMVGEDLWYYVRETKRPTRITPIQRLSGAVSYGDLARLSWTRDYSIDQFIENDSIDDKIMFRLDLSATSGAATYQKVQLWIDPGSKQPVLAKVFLLSGKHYKSIYFSKYEKVSGKIVNTEMTFVDHLRKDETTLLKFVEIKEIIAIPDRYFIKTYLPDLSNEIIE